MLAARRPTLLPGCGLACPHKRCLNPQLPLLPASPYPCSLPRPAAAGRAPMFFRKAIDDATSEWAQHHAKRFIDTKTKVGGLCVVGWMFGCVAVGSQV